MTTAIQTTANGEHLQGSELQQILQFMVQDIHCCVRLDHVERVLPLMALQSVPAGPDYLVGLLNLHGTSVPVVDASIRIGQEVSEGYDVNTPVLLCSNDERRIGLVVSEVVGVEFVSMGDLQMRSDFEGVKAPLLAVIETEKQLSLLLDLPAIMDIDLSAHSSHLLPVVPA